MVTSKYENLANYLAGREGQMIRMKFKEIEDQIEGPLPGAAYEHRAWWANSESNNHAVHGWLQAGWETSRVDMDNQELIFARRAPRGQFQFAIPTAPAARSRTPDYSRGAVIDSTLIDILDRTGGVINLSNLVQTVEDYIHGEMDEMELGRLLRKHWPRR